MNKAICLIAGFSIAAFAQNEQKQYYVNMEQRKIIQKLIEAGLEKNKEEIQKESFYLSPADKEDLYENNRKEHAAVWAALDYFVGFGVGSYIQGDMAFGITQSILDGLGWTFGMYALFLTIPWCDASDDCPDIDENTKNKFIGAFASAIILLGSSRCMSLIFPFVHQYRYNKTLKTALNSDKLAYSIDPLIVPKDGVPAIGLAFNLHF